jgi:hypothetical protein
MIDRDPIELRAEIALSLSHQVAGEGPEVGHFQCIIWRDDEAEVMPIILAALSKSRGIDPVTISTEHLRPLTITRDTFAAEVSEVGAELAAGPNGADDARLDDGTTRSIGDEAIGDNAGTLADTEARPVARPYPALTRHGSTGALSCGKCLLDERANPLATFRSDATRAEAELILVGHPMDPYFVLSV